jgi:hypothetical protein
MFKHTRFQSTQTESSPLQGGKRTLRRLRRILLVGTLAGVIGFSAVPVTPANADWPYPAAVNGFSANGTCWGNDFTKAKGDWYFTGSLNSPLAGGDTYKIQFRPFVNGKYGEWTKGWWGPYQVPQAGPSSFLPVRIPVAISMDRGAWIAVQMKIYSVKKGQEYTDWLKQDALGPRSWAEVSPDGYYCKALPRPY